MVDANPAPAFAKETHTHEICSRQFMNWCKVGAAIITMYGGRYKFDRPEKNGANCTKSTAPHASSVLNKICVALWRALRELLAAKKSIYLAKWIKM
jgi:hypothetical protein